MFYSVIGLLAIVVLLIVNGNILFGSRTSDKPDCKFYRRFLYAVLAYYVTDVLWGIFENQKLSGALYVDTVLYFAALSLSIASWAEYAVCYLNEKNTFGKFFVIFGRSLAGLIMGMTIVNVFIPVLFVIDSQSVYTALYGRHIAMVCYILYLIVISVRSLSHMIKKPEKRTRYRILALSGFIMVFCLIIQLWFPYLPLGTIAYMFGTCLLPSFVVNDEREERRNELNEAAKITELKDRFRSLLDNMPGMTFTKEAGTGIYMACNREFLKYAGKETPEDVVGLTDAQIFDAETAAHFEETDRLALSLSKPLVYTEDVKDASGSLRHYQTTKLKYIDTAGRRCVLGMSQDITDIVVVKHEQDMSREAYEEAVSTGLMYSHMAQTLAMDYLNMFYVNTDSEEFTEYGRDEEGEFTEVRKGMHFFSDCKEELLKSVFTDDRDEFLKAVNRKKLMAELSKNDTVVVTYRQMVNGNPVYVSMKISRMENDHNHIIIGFMNIDAEMKETISRNEALSDALSYAEAANKAKNTFLSGMSHEIRTPINVIIGLDTLALKKLDLDNETKGYFEKIGDNARKLLTLVNDVLNMSMIESGKGVLNNVQFSLSTLLDQVNSTVSDECAGKGLEYEYNVLDQIDDIYIGDDIKLRQVLLNILSNAVKYTDSPGSVSMTVEKISEYKDQDSLRFRISDTGIGIDKEKIPSLFDASSLGSTGKGLGMVITKRIVDMMNGDISVKSEKDVGTEFTIIVTLRKGTIADLTGIGEIDLKALHILVIDDNPVEAEHAKMILEEVGIRADICTSGQEALSKMEVQHARQRPYNFVLMDWNMPGMNGSETSSKIVKLYGKETTVVAMTAYNWDVIREEALKAGVENYLEKPLFAANIIESIEQIAMRSQMNLFKEKKKARLTGRRILLAEDIEINAEIMMDMLELENIKVDHAKDGQVAVDLFENSTEGIYSAILMDVRMPIMDGLEATKVIRSMDRPDAKRIPIIALTADSFDEDVQLSLQAGMNAHLSKPVESDTLIRILGEMIYEAEQSL